jgi:hypothetical protein
MVAKIQCSRCKNADLEWVKWNGKRFEYAGCPNCGEWFPLDGYNPPDRGVT